MSELSHWRWRSKIPDILFVWCLCFQYYSVIHRRISTFWRNRGLLGSYFAWRLFLCRFPVRPSSTHFCLRIKHANNIKLQTMLSHPNIVLLRVRMSLLDPKWYLRFCLGRTIFCRYNVHRINSAKIHRPKRVLKVYLLLSAYLEMSSIFAFIFYFVRNSYCLMLFCITLLNFFFFNSHVDIFAMHSWILCWTIMYAAKVLVAAAAANMSSTLSTTWVDGWHCGFAYNSMLLSSSG